MIAISYLNFYLNNKSKQYHRRPWCSTVGHIIKPIVNIADPQAFIIPNAGDGDVDYIRLEDEVNGYYMDLTSDLSAGIQQISDADDNLLLYKGNQVLNPATDRDVYDSDDNLFTSFSLNEWVTLHSQPDLGHDYYLKISVDGNVYYSDFIDLKQVQAGAPNDCDERFIRLEYTDTCAIVGTVRIPYEKLDTFSFVMWLPAPLLRPLYPVTTEDQEDDENQSNSLFLRANKEYSFEMLMPEYLIDALALVQLHQTIVVIDWYGNTYSGLSLRLDDISWGGDGGDCFADVKGVFSIKIASKTGCC